MAKQYYSYHIVNRKKDERLWLEYHTGSDRKEVRAGESLNHAMLLSSPTFQTTFEAWEFEIDLYELERA